MRLNNCLCCLLLLALITGCASAPPESAKAVRGIAVWDMEDLSPMGDGRPDLGGLLSAKVIETVKGKSAYDVVERERLILVLEEQNLGTSGLADESTRLRLGRLVGAQLMIFGAYQVIGGQMRLDIRLVEVETGKILKATEKTVSAGDLAAWLNAAAEAAAELVQ
ncbi:Curli production assembly/transport component CsgG [uncultured Desulfobacterium sp.]|uniref:Curli production assembly/transport component CsgG n=1 Tax=uncultured Desulfobacterium sp. TaxID=201089 RepID=A0A445MUF5_9BACT|nr:Curli production assembly/transport component CsgG [uncultured Desulfobacterium sp.]